MRHWLEIRGHSLFLGDIDSKVGSSFLNDFNSLITPAVSPGAFPSGAGHLLESSLQGQGISSSSLFMGRTSPRVLPSGPGHLLSPPSGPGHLLASSLLGQGIPFANGQC